MIVYVSMLESNSDKDVFQKLYDENRQKLYRTAYKILHNEADAEDAVHTCFVKLAANFAKYRHLPYENLVMLCTTIVKNAANDIHREYAKETHFYDEDGLGECHAAVTTPDVLDQLIKQYDSDLIIQALMELTEEERELLTLQYGLEQKPKDIAKLLDIPPHAVRKKMLRCRHKLARILEGKNYEC